MTTDRLETILWIEALVTVRLGCPVSASALDCVHWMLTGEGYRSRATA